jgi:DNA integrity scanning protein DisA with diadenylate cyclase activity
MTVARPDGHLHHIFTGKSARRGNIIRPEVLLRVLSLAVELANEGREGRPVGTMFVVGDSRQVLRCAQQLVLNPFHGFSQNLRNVLDPSLGETIKEFAQIDGAFVVKGDGTVLTAGTYLAPKASVRGLPSGLGARHTTAAGITAHTRAIGVTVSQSTGAVTIFHKGNIVTALECTATTRW